MIIGNLISIGNHYRGQGGSEQATVPSPLMAWSKDTTTANLQWNNPGSDNFILERATQSDYSDATQVYSGTDTEFEDSGLTIATTYYYRVKSQKATFDDSEWAISSVTTIRALPDFWYELTGIAYPTIENEYGETGTTPNATVVETIKSVVNTDGFTLAVGALKGTISPKEFTSPYGSIQGANTNFYTATSVYSFSGNFTFAFRFKLAGTISNLLLLANSTDSNYWLRLNSTTQIRINVNTVGVTLTFSALTLHHWYDCVIKRVGTTLSVSFDGGKTAAATGVVSSSDFIFDQFFRYGQINYERFVGYNSDVASNVVDQVFAYLKQPEYSESDEVTPLVTGVTWEDHSGDYIVNTSFAINVLASYIRDRIINIGDYTFMLGNTKTTDPNYSNDFIIIKQRSTGKISDIKYLGVPLPLIVDDHNSGSIFRDDNRIKHVEMSGHYDSGTPQPTSVVIKEFGNKFDFTSFVNRTLANGIAYFTNSTTQYHLFHRFDATQKAFLFQYWVGGFSGAQYTGILRSSDNLNYFQKELVVDVGTTYWVYFSPVYGPDGKIRLFLNIENKTGEARNNLYDYICYIESADGLTWTNKAGDFSQNVSDNNPISLANLVANCLVQDASELTGSARMSWAFYDSDGEIHGICGDGDDTGLQMFYWDGNSWVFQDIDPGTKTLISDMRQGNGDNAPILIRTAENSYDAYVHEDNGGLWKIIKKSTTDKGVTWTDGEDFSTDDTHQHRRMHVNRDALYNDHITIAAARVVTDGTPDEDNSDIFIKDI